MSDDVYIRLISHGLNDVELSKVLNLEYWPDNDGWVKTYCDIPKDVFYENVNLLKYFFYTNKLTKFNIGDKNKQDLLERYKNTFVKEKNIDVFFLYSEQSCGYFDQIVLCYNDGKHFYWRNINYWVNYKIERILLMSIIKEMSSIHQFISKKHDY